MENEPKAQVTIAPMLSPTIGKLAEALSKAQGQFSHAKKDSDNPYFKSKYADLACVIDAAKDPLAKNGLSVTQITRKSGDELVLVTLLMHTSGEWIMGEYPVKPTKPDPQGFGSAITYARRYAFSAITGIASDDDDGNAASEPRFKTAKAQKDRFKEIKEEIESSEDPAAIWKKYRDDIDFFKGTDEQFYDDLKKAGAQRKNQLSVEAGMPEGFNRVTETENDQ